MDRGTVDTPVYDQVRDVDPFLAELARRLCAVARSPALAAAKAAKPAPPRRLAVAPVNRMVPRPRSSMWRAASRPVTNPANRQVARPAGTGCRWFPTRLT